MGLPIVSQGTLLLYSFILITYVVWYFIVVGVIKADPMKYSPVSPTYDNTLTMPSTALYGVFMSIFLFSFSVYLVYHIEICRSAMRFFNSMLHSIHKIAIEFSLWLSMKEVKTDSIKTSIPVKRDEKYESSMQMLKTHITTLPMFLLNVLKIDDAESNGQIGFSNISAQKNEEYDSEDEAFLRNTQKWKNLNVRTTTFRYVTKMQEGAQLIEKNLLLTQGMFPTSVALNTNKSSYFKGMYYAIFDRVSDIIGINETPRPTSKYLYNIVMFLLGCVHIVWVLISWFQWGWIYGTIVSFVHVCVMVYLVDGVKTISPTFNESTEGYSIMTKQATNTTHEVAHILRNEEDKKHFENYRNTKEKSKSRLVPVQQWTLQPIPIRK